MFYQLQFNAIQQKIGRRVAAMAADVEKYAATPNANPKAIEAREAIVNEFNNYLEYVNGLYLEFRQQQHTDFSAGFDSGYRKAVNEYEPHLRIRTNNKELDRFNSLTRVRLDFPNLF